MTKQAKAMAGHGFHFGWLAAGIAGFFLGGTLIALQAHPAQSPSSATPATSQTAAAKYKNIKVLKDIPAEELIPSMQFITAALGVECGFCHVTNQGKLEFDKDDKKEKKTAREMMQMMFAINKGNFDGERQVTCNTCHRGSAHPQSIPAIMAEAPKSEAMEAMHEHEHDMDPAKLPSGAPVMAKYIQAIGGAAKLDKVSNRIEKGNAVMPDGPPIPIDIYTKAPDQRVSVMHMQKGDSITAYNGQAGWISFTGRPPREMSPADQQAAKLDAEAFYPTQLEREFTELKLDEHSEKVDGYDANVVLALAKGQPPVKLYFDKDSGLLVRMVHYADTPLGFNPTQVDFADYREIGGVKTPYHWTIARPSGSFTIKIDEVKENAPMDDAMFVKPAAPPQPK
ncbi:MAG: c-type cytochrome [Candidatus Korobacteraceae bacterium]